MDQERDDYADPDLPQSKVVSFPVLALVALVFLVCLYRVAVWLNSLTPG